MTVGLVVITDGRKDYLTQTLASAKENLQHGFCDRLIVNDSGSQRYDGWLRETYPEFRVISHPRRCGLAAAVQTAWTNGQGDFLFHLEEDFLFLEPIELEPMMRVLVTLPALAQIALKRQPWSPEEQRAGGIVEMHPEDYSEILQNRWWLTLHRRLFTLNPCLIPRHILELGWPESNEAGFSQRLLDDGYRFAYWGRKLAPPVVLHIGADRSPAWSL